MFRLRGAQRFGALMWRQLRRPSKADVRISRAFDPNIGARLDERALKLGEPGSTSTYFAFAPTACADFCWTGFVRLMSCRGAGQ
jgi:hypothetical protein